MTGVLVFAGMLARPQRRPTATSITAARRVEPVSFKNVAVSPGPAPSIEEPSANAAAAPAASSAVPAAAPVSDAISPRPEVISLQLEFEDDSWLELRADGRPVFSGLQHRGTKRTFEARRGFRITLGNAGAVRVTVDGHSLEPLGASGQVVRDLPLPRGSTLG